MRFLDLKILYSELLAATSQIHTRILLDALETIDVGNDSITFFKPMPEILLFDLQRGFLDISIVMLILFGCKECMFVTHDIHQRVSDFAGPFYFLLPRIYLEPLLFLKTIGSYTGS
ncbi:hypothetical protein SD66_08565 [Enterobacter cloacae]|nr:hypothetical protein SD66_08565 [Enterobacter cloacae]